jgi:hypothetical protein
MTLGSSIHFTFSGLYRFIVLTSVSKGLIPLEGSISSLA